MLPRRPPPPPLSPPPSPAPQSTALVGDITAGAQSCALFCPSAVSIDLVERLTQSGVMRQRSSSAGRGGAFLCFGGSYLYDAAGCNREVWARAGRDWSTSLSLWEPALGVGLTLDEAPDGSE